jgi:hypothetical protein
MLFGGKYEKEKRKTGKMVKEKLARENKKREKEKEKRGRKWV